MKLQAIFTEKSINEAKNGKYSFWVGSNMNKSAIKSLIGSVFGVHVVSVATIKSKRRTKKSVYGKIKTILGGKKAIVKLKKGETIDVFEQKDTKSKEKTKKAKK